jgi:hypothetical protein
MILLAERANQAFMADQNGQLSGNTRSSFGRSSNFGRGFSRGFSRGFGRSFGNGQRGNFRGG